MKMKLDSISFFLVAELLLFFFQRVIVLRPLRLPENEVITWLLALSLYALILLFLLFRKKIRQRVL